MHRERLIDSFSFLAVALFAAALAALAVGVSIIALARLWHTGDQGWSKALLGLLLGTICLVPVGWYGALALRYPAVTDIATTDRGALPLVFEPDTTDMPPPRLLTDEQKQHFFPNVATRTYPTDPAQLFAIVDTLVKDRGWDIRFERAPEASGSPGQLNARIVTLAGWREEAVLRVEATAGGAAVDMRSASINAVHDFGSNGRRISAFLVDLDNAVTDFLRDNPNTGRPADDEDDSGTPDVQTGTDN